MRCSRRGLLGGGAAAIALALGVAAAAIGAPGCAGCTPATCGRNSDCPSGQICTAAEQCSLAPEAAIDGAGDAGAADAAAPDAAPADAPAARVVPDPPDHARYPRRHGRRRRPLP